MYLIDTNKYIVQMCTTINTGTLAIPKMNMSSSGKNFLFLLLFFFSASFASAQINVTFTTMEPSCHGLPTGSITAIASGGTGPYTFAWESGQSTATIENVSAGDYTVTVTDANSLTEVVNVTLTQPSKVTAELTADDCDLPATITAVGSGGVGGPYTYKWGTGESTASITVTSAGQYCVTITDAASCGLIACITVDATPLDVNVLTTDLTCPDSDDGTLTAATTGGDAPLAFEWSNGATTETVSGLAEGIYSVTVTDNSGCTATASGTIAAPPDLIILLGADSPTCVGDTDGQITANAAGGTPNYTFEWSTGATTQVITGLAAGTYSVTATDANNCEVVDSITLSPVSEIAISTDSEDESCPEANDGSATVVASNGVAPYAYLWSNDETTATITGLEPGVYRVTVTDDVGCQRIGFEIVSEADPLEITASKTDITTCGADDGTASVVVDDGAGPFTYDWSNGDTTAVIDSLIAGDYTVTVTDANECFAEATVTIIEPPAVDVTLDATTSICAGEDDGIIVATPVGGTAPFDYEWSNGDTTATTDSLAAGTYILTLTDANGCSVVDSATIVESLAISATVRTTQFVCGGVNAGEAVVEINGGVGPFRYSWNTGSSDDRIIGLGTGEYRVTITDDNGCEAEAVGRVTIIDEIAVTGIPQNTSCAGDSTGSVRIEITGGMAPYTFAWSDGSTDSTLTDVPAGLYSVEVKDSMDCMGTATFLVTEPDSLKVDLGKLDIECGDQATSAAGLVVSGGTAPYEVEWSNNATTDTITGIPMGTYQVTVTDANECSVVDSVTIVNPGSPICTIRTNQNASNADAMDGELEAIVVGGQGPYTFLWSNGDTTQTLTGVGAGDYSLTVTDALGCETTCSTTLDPNNALLGDYVWYDFNRDGIQDEDEHGIEGIEIILTPIDSDGREDQDTVYTDADGLYLFEVPPGKYKLTINQPDSLRITSQDTGSNDSIDSDFGRRNLMTDTIMLMAGDKDLTWDAGFINAPGIAITDPCNCLDNATNDKNGQYGEEVVVVRGIPGDTWSIIAQEGMYSNDSPDPPALPITIPAGTLLTESSEEPGLFEIQFRHVEEEGYNITVSNEFDTLTIGATCFYPEITIKSLPADSITFCLNADPIVLEAETNIDGVVKFFLNDEEITVLDPAALGLGTYKLRAEIQPTDTTECKGVTVGDLFVINEFCPSTIGDFVWFDEDQDGVQDPGEPGVPGVKVILTPIDVVDARTDQDTAITDENGRYLFDVLEGFYKLTFCVPEEYRLTLPNVAVTNDSLDSDVSRDMMMTDIIFIAGGTDDLTYDAGLIPPPVIPTLPDCDCLNNATMEDNGQFAGQIVLEGLAGETWTVIAASEAFDVASPAPPALPTPLAVNTALTETSPGIFELNFRHIDATPYNISISNGMDTINATRTCAYPDIIVTGVLGGVLEACINAEPFVPEISTSVEGEIELSIDGVVVTEIDPASLGAGTYELVIKLTPNDDEECEAIRPVSLVISADGCPAKLGNFVWIDKDEDGIQDSGEPGVEGVEVILQTPDGSGGFTDVDVTMTDENGRYCFEVAPGDYKVTFVAFDERYGPTIPNAGDNDERDSDIDPATLMSPVVTIGGGETNLSIDAGFSFICINVDDPGEIGYDQMICAPGNDPDPIVNIEEARGGEGEIEYLWMKSTTNSNFSLNGFTAIPGATGLSYDPGPIFATTHYARCVRIKGCEDYLEANIVTVEVKSDSKAEIIADPIFCYFQPAVFKVETNTANPVVVWEFPEGVVPNSTEGKEVSAVFSRFGYYTVKATVTENGCTTSSTITVLGTYTPLYCDQVNLVVDANADPSVETVKLEWRVLNDGLDYSFDIEHSGTGSTFAKIAEVKDPASMKEGYKNYEYIDVQPKKGRNLYRVKMKDVRGSSSLSNIMELMLFEPGTEIMIYPNPVQDRLMVEFAKKQSEEIQIELVSAEGTILRTVTWDANTVQRDMDFSAYPSGLYFIRIKVGSENTEVLKVFKKE